MTLVPFNEVFLSAVQPSQHLRTPALAQHLSLIHISMDKTETFSLPTQAPPDFQTLLGPDNFYIPAGKDQSASAPVSYTHLDVYKRQAGW